jgi:hypothetical protein
MLEHADKTHVRKLFELACAKRPAEELYDLRRDPEQLNNVVGVPDYAAARKELAAALQAELAATGDPRALDAGDVFDRYPYYGGQQPRR